MTETRGAKTVLKKVTAQRLRELLFDDQGKAKQIFSEISCDGYDIDEESHNLCLGCRLTPVDEIIFTHNGFGAWHHEWQQVKTCAEKGCALCRYLVEFFKTACFSSSVDSSPPRDNDRVRIEWVTGFNQGYLIQAARLMAKAKRSPYYQGPHGLPISYTTGPSDHINYWACPMYVLDPDYAEPHRHADSTNGQPSSRVRAHLDTCFRSHPDCGTSEPPSLPTRVLDLQHTRLHESSPSERGHYTALSYCWGGSRLFQTTKALYSDFQREIHLEEMPRTLLDAVTVTRDLGIRYLWIDALCIIQDDLLDLVSEIDKMTDIYKNATVVIAAEAAITAQDGFLEQKLPESVLRLPVNNPDFSVSRSIFLVIDDPRKQIGLSTRAWVFQEFMLANRLLIYTRYGPIWSCHSSKETAKTPGLHTQTWLWRKYQSAKTSFDGEIPPIPYRANATHSWRQLWLAIVSTYNTLELTYAGDKLPAIAGIAKAFQRRIGESYVAGFWERDLVFQLGWWRERESEHRDAEQRMPAVPLRPDEDGVIPSWSWASVSGPIGSEHTQVLKEDTVLRVVSCDVEPLNIENKFGKVKKARLEVDAFTFALSSVQYDHGGATMDHSDSKFHWDSGYSGNYIGMLLGKDPPGPGYGGGWECLLIEPAGHETYRRVGYYRDGSEVPPSAMDRRRLVLV